MPAKVVAMVQSIWAGWAPPLGNGCQARNSWPSDPVVAAATAADQLAGAHCRQLGHLSPARPQPSKCPSCRSLARNCENVSTAKRPSLTSLPRRMLPRDYFGQQLRLVSGAAVMMQDEASAGRGIP